MVSNGASTCMKKAPKVHVGGFKETKSSQSSGHGIGVLVLDELSD